MPAYQQFELYMINGHYAKAEAQINLIISAIKSFQNNYPISLLSILLKKNYQSKIKIVDKMIQNKAEIEY